MSLILQALKRAKEMTDRKPGTLREDATLSSFGFRAAPAKHRVKRVLVMYLAPAAVLAVILVSGLRYWMTREGGRPASSEIIAASSLQPAPPQRPPPEAVAPALPDPLPAGQQSSVQVLSAVALPRADTAISIPPSSAARKLLPLATTSPAPNVPETAAEPAPPPPASPPPGPVNERLADKDIRIAPPLADPFELAVHYQRNGDYLKAFEAYKVVLDRDPLNAFALNNVGLLHQATSNNAEAIKTFRSAISINARYDKAHNNLGTSLMRDGQNAEAAREFQRALDLNPANADARTNLGIIARKTGNPEQAKTHFLMALQVNSNSPETHYNLALLYEEQGETGNVIQHFQKFLSLGSNLYPDLAREVEKKLEELRKRLP